MQSLSFFKLIILKTNVSKNVRVIEMNTGKAVTDKSSCEKQCCLMVVIVFRPLWET